MLAHGYRGSVRLSLPPPTLGHVTSKKARRRGANVGKGDSMRWLGGAREFAAGVGIESRYRPDLWLWARVAGDMLDLSMLGTVLASPGRDLARRSHTAVATAAVVGVTVADGVAAVRVSRNGAQNGEQGKTMSDVEAKASITVNRPVEEVFVYWQNFENLPQFMAHLQSVES